jgi:hypothetical protein
MLLWTLITLSLTLAGLTGMQFFYMMILERRDREQKKRIHELERRCIFLASRVDDAEEKLSEQNELLAAMCEEFEGEESGPEEVWADVIDDH